MIRALLKDVMFNRQSVIAAVVLGLEAIIFFSLTGVQSSWYFRGRNMPLLTVSGEELPNDRYTCYAPIDAATLDQYKKSWEGRAVVWPFLYRNLQFMYVRSAMDVLYLSVLVVPDEFLNKYMGNRLASGKLPTRGAMQCLAGACASSAWRFVQGDYLEIGFEKEVKFDKVTPQQAGKNAFEVVGILSPGLKFQFLEGAVLVPQSAYEQMMQKQPPYNCFFAYPSSWWTSARPLERSLHDTGLKAFRIRHQWSEIGGTSYVLLALGLMTVSMSQSFAASNLKQRLKTVGIMMAQGLSQWRIALTFFFSDFVVQGLGVFIGLVAAKYIFMLLNMNLMHISPQTFYTYATYYGFDTTAASLLVLAIFSSTLVRMGRTMWLLSSTSPDEMIRGKAE